MISNPNEWFSYLIEQIQENKMKSVHELLKYLNRRFEVQEFPLNGISKSFLAANKFNALHSYGAVLDIDPLSFRAFKIERTSESKLYFSERLTDYSSVEFPVESPNEHELLLFLFEEQTNYFWINNSFLHCELIVERGINQDCILSTNPIFQEYESAKRQIKIYRNKIRNEI